MALPNRWQTLQPGALTAAPKLGLRVAKGLSCDRMGSLFFPVNPRPPRPPPEI